MSEQAEITKPSLKAQSAWLLIAKTAGFALSFLLPLLVVRYLDQTQVGIYRQAFQVVTTMVAILPFGFSASAYYFLSRDKKDQPYIVFNILLFNFVIGGIVCALLAFLPQSLGKVFQDSELTHLAPLIGVVIWLWVFGAFLEIVAVANQEPRLATFFIIFSQFTKTLFMVTAVVMFATVESFVYAAIVQGAVQTVVLLLYLNYKFRGFWHSFDFGILKRQFFYVLPYGLMALLWIVQTDIHNYFVGYRFSAADFAVYVYGCFQLPLLGILYESVTSVMIPRMSALQHEGNKREMIEVTVRAMDKLAFFYFPIYALLLITGYDLITALFTQNYAASVPVFLINITLIPFGILISDPIVRAFPELGRFLLKLRLVIIPLMIAALWLGINYLDLRGIIAIVVVTTLVERLITMTRAAKTLGVKREDGYLLLNMGKTAIATLFAGLITYGFYIYFRELTPSFGRQISGLLFSTPKESLVNLISGGLTVAGCGVVLFAIYLLIANYLGVITTEEKNSIKRLFIRAKGGAELTANS
jgi:O-antigen/teichoic acid export membrane protein